MKVGLPLFSVLTVSMYLYFWGEGGLPRLFLPSSASTLYLLIASSVGYFFYGNNEISAVKRLQKYCDALSTRHFYSAWTNLATQAQFAHVINQDQLTYNVDKDASPHEGISSCMISVESEHGTTANGTIIYEYGDRSLSMPHKYTLFYNDQGNPS